MHIQFTRDFSKNMLFFVLTKNIMSFPLLECFFLWNCFSSLVLVEWQAIRRWRADTKKPNRPKLNKSSNQDIGGQILDHKNNIHLEFHNAPKTSFTNCGFTPNSVQLDLSPLVEDGAVPKVYAKIGFLPERSNRQIKCQQTKYEYSNQIKSRKSQRPKTRISLVCSPEFPFPSWLYIY